MPIRHFVNVLALGLVLSLVSSPSSSAQGAAQTASDFYKSFRVAFEKATAIEDLLPYMSQETRGQVEATPPADRAKMFEFVKMMGTVTNLRIIKESRSEHGVTLTVEAVDFDNKRTTGTVEIVREGSTWKLGRESWSSSS
jgi:hypothetical protein